MTNATVWKQHAGLLIPDGVEPWTREELVERLVEGENGVWPVDWLPTVLDARNGWPRRG